MTTIDSLIIGAADPGAAERFYPAAFGPDVDQVVLLLGAEDVGASKTFYVDHGLTVAKGSASTSSSTPGPARSRSGC